MAFVNALLSDSSIAEVSRQEALDRIYSDPGIPEKLQATESFWLKHADVRFAQKRSDQLPETAEIVIIGSGITGSSVAHTLLQSYQANEVKKTAAQPSLPPKIVLLEARDICSGATGRNGGHILETAEEYADLKGKWGKDTAKKITKFRLAHLEILLNMAEELNLSVKSQARRVQFLSVYFDSNLWYEAKERLAIFLADMPEHMGSWGTFEGDYLKNELQMPHAIGAVYGPAGAIWPYNFVTGLLAHLRSQFPSDFLLETNTPATQINAGLGSFEVVTPRGTIRCKHVIHCTNAHASHLVPGLAGRIYPIRGQMSAQSPGRNFHHQGNKHSWIFNYPRGFDYLTQLPQASPVSDGEMMLGGGFSQAKGSGITEIGIATDEALNTNSELHLSGALDAVFGRDNSGKDEKTRVKAMWTGNMGFSTDGFAWVGSIPQSVTDRRWVPANTELQEPAGREWIAAAFSGEGMVNAWCCGDAVAKMLLAHEGVLSAEASSEFREWFPEPMLFTESRYREARQPRRVAELVSRHAPSESLLSPVAEL